MWDGGAEYRGCRRAGGRIGARRAVGGGGGAHGALARLRVDAGAVAGAASLAEVGAGDMSEATFYKHELASRHVGRRCAGLAGEPQGQALAGVRHFLRDGTMALAAAQFDAGVGAQQPAVGVDDPRRARVATDLCRLCFTAGRDGADVWPGMENRRCRRGTGGVVGDAVFAVVGQLCLRAVGAAGGDR